VIALQKDKERVVDVRKILRQVLFRLMIFTRNLKVVAMETRMSKNRYKKLFLKEKIRQFNAAFQA